jgi:rhodanese-related sulfurtransferase
MGLKEMVAEAKGRVDEIAPAELQSALESGEDVVVIDVREPHEFSQGHLPGAVNIPRGMLELKADELAEERHERVVTYCLKAPGARSLFAADTLTKMGFANVAAMTAGVNGWAEAGLPLEPVSD